MMKLKDEIKGIVEEFRDKVQQYELNYSRYIKIKATLANVLKQSGISIQTLNDLK